VYNALNPRRLARASADLGEPSRFTVAGSNTVARSGRWKKAKEKVQRKMPPRGFALFTFPFYFLPFLLRPLL
jgi:hypothetical protein